jgi:transposase
MTVHEPVTEASRRWAEFRLAVVGHLVVGELERGKLRAELKALSQRKWKHPITGTQVLFGYSTIERWYYIAVNNSQAPSRALSKRRCDAGRPRSLTKNVRHYLASQAKRHSSWSYRQHHQTLVRYMKEQQEWGPPPGCSAIRRYLRTLSTSQIGEVHSEVTRLRGLVAHLRRTLIAESTQNWLLRVTAFPARSLDSPFRFSRFGPNEKAYVLSRLRDYTAAGGSQSEFCAGVGISTASLERWAASYRRCGDSGLLTRTRRRFPNRTHARKIRACILEIFHSQPSAHGINRASWTGASLAEALHGKFRVRVSPSTARRHLRASGYTMRRARQVLTSSDPDYRTKVELLLHTLRTLADTEMLFFVDELGPVAVRKYGGRSFVKRGNALVVPQIQTSKGSVLLAGALSATTNQMTWCYVPSKDSTAMIDLIELLFCQHRDKTHLYLTWDAASWHDSASLVDWLDAFNMKTTETGDGPLISMVPLPSCSQFLNVIESTFAVMKKAVVHHSDYRTPHEMKSSISRHFWDRNLFFQDNPRRAGKKIWDLDFFNDMDSLRAGNYREW